MYNWLFGAKWNKLHSDNTLYTVDAVNSGESHGLLLFSRRESDSYMHIINTNIYPRVFRISFCFFFFFFFTKSIICYMWQDKCKEAHSISTLSDHSLHICAANGLRKRANSARVTFLSEKVSLEVREEWRNLLDKQVTGTVCRSILKVSQTNSYNMKTWCGS